jgi:hypothetical protein
MAKSHDVVKTIGTWGGCTGVEKEDRTLDEKIRLKEGSRDPSRARGWR